MEHFTLLQDAAASIGKGGPGFPSLSAMLADAQGQRARCREVEADSKGLLFVPEGDGVGLEAPGLEVGGMTPWALRQVGTLAGVPAGVLDRLQPATAARVLNETFPRDLGPRSLLVEASAFDGGRSALRAITSPTYRRVWDAALLSDVTRWLEPTGWGPGRVTLSGHGDDPRRTLWRSDRDSFAFFMTERDGSRPGPASMLGQFDDDGLGGMRRMLFVGNSEVGARSLQWGEGWFRGICCNLGLWGAEEVTVRRRRHTRGVLHEVRDLSRFIRETAATVTDRDLEPFRALAAATFPVPQKPEEWTKRAAAVLAERWGFTKAEAGKAAEWAEHGDRGAPAGSWWAVVNGLTGPASADLNPGDRADLSIRAGKVVAAGLEAVGA